MHDVFVVGDGLDIESHLQDSIRSGEFEMATRTKKTAEQKPIIGIQVITMTCSCGAACESENGSTMIEYFDKIVWCTSCDKRYEVPASAFEKRWLDK